MKNKLFILLCLLFCWAQIYAQTANSTNGKVHTTSGDIRFLIVLAASNNYCNTHDCSNVSALFNASSFFYSNNSQFSNTAQDVSISNYFYQHTRNNPNRPAFKVTGEVFPNVISVPTYQDGTAVFQKMMTTYPNFNYANFDKRTNRTANYTVNNSSTSPDGILDYVVLVWLDCSGCGGFAGVSNYSGANYSIQDGFTLLEGGGGDITNIFLHEFAHSNFDCPHYNGANQLSGKYWNTNTGWGCMNYGSLRTSNAWESWYNGWIDLKNTSSYDATSRDLSSSAHNGYYILKDFLTTGDAMRVKVPNSDVNLWIENHAALHPFDQYNPNFWQVDALGNPMPTNQLSGIRMFTEKLAGSRLSPITNALNQNLTNGTKTLTRQGNIDFDLNSWKNDGKFSLPYPALTYTGDNVTPTSQNNLAGMYAENSPFETTFPDKIKIKDGANNSGESNYNSCINEFSGYQESQFIFDVNGTIDIYSRDIAFQPGDKIGVSEKSIAHNMPYYDPCAKRIQTTYLNGLSVEIINKYSDGSIAIRVLYDDVLITKDQRIIGDVVLTDVPNTTYDLDVNPNIKFTIQRPRSANRHTKASDGTFINPSKFQLNASTKVNLRSNAQFKVIQDSKLSCLSGSKIDINAGASLAISDNSLVCFEDGITQHLNFLSPNSSKFIYHGTDYYGGYSFSNVTVSTVNAYDNITTNGNVTLPATGNISLNSQKTVVLSSGVSFLANSGRSVTITSGKLPNFQCLDVLPQYRLENDDHSNVSTESFHIDYINNTSEENIREISHETVKINELAIYPNPVTGGLIKFSAVVTDITLSDMTGTKVKNSKQSDHLDVSGLPKGVYMLKLDDKTEKIIIQ